MNIKAIVQNGPYGNYLMQGSPGSWGAASYMLGSDADKESKEVSKAGKKRGFWQTAAGLAGTGLMYGALASNPVGWLGAAASTALGTGALIGGASLAGSLLGRAATHKSGQVLKGNVGGTGEGGRHKFHKDEREEIREDIFGDMLMSTGTSAAGGFTAASKGGDLFNIWSAGAEASKVPGLFKEHEVPKTNLDLSYKRPGGSTFSGGDSGLQQFENLGPS